MHLQKAIDDYDVVRPLAVDRRRDDGDAVPARPADAPALRGRPRLPAAAGRAEVVTIGRLVNAFFRWEFNSCETLVKDGEVYPIDYANACPDVALTSLHYYFPWAMKALVKWCVFALVTGRRPRLDLDDRPVLRRSPTTPGLSYEEKLDAYRALADAYFESERYQTSARAGSPHLDEIVLDWVGRARLRRAADPDGPVGLPGPRARPVHRAPARPARPVGARRERPPARQRVRRWRATPCDVPLWRGYRSPYLSLSGLSEASWVVISRRSRSAARTGASTETRSGARWKRSPRCCGSACSRPTRRRWARRSS